ncbi:MAG: hypothetical protein GYB67_15170 [Chloroflexi bacterium]|nr:hypothetical protein [Chloroflexota bacterium]
MTDASRQTGRQYRGRLISWREWRRVILFTLLILALTTLPYLIGWGSQGEDWRFSGLVFGVEDGNSYLGKLRLGMRGFSEFSLFYTSEPHDSAPLLLLYLLPGQIAGQFVAADDPASPETLMLTFHLLRVIGAALLIFTIYRFIAAFVAAPGVRFTALILATLGGGVGWLLALTGQGDLLGSLPPDVFIPEGFTFLILLGLPHLAIGRAALLGGLLALIAAADRRSPRAWLPYALLAGVLWLIVGIAVPFYLAIIYAILGAWGLAAWARAGRFRAFPQGFPWGLFWRCVVAAALTLPMFAYHALIFTTNPAFAVWSAQNLLFSPHPLQYVLAYALIGGLALVGGRWAWRQANRAGGLRMALLIGWPLIVPILVYLPINVQRRLAEAVLIPLAILAAVGLRMIARRWLRRGALIAAVLTSIFLLFGFMLAAATPSRPLFRSTAERAALAWLDAQAAPDAVVLSSARQGNALPAYTNLRTYMGHGPETLFWPQKTATLEAFYRGGLTPDARADLLAPSCAASEPLCPDPINYVLYGPLERALVTDPDDIAAWSRGLTLIYDRDGYQIYAVPEPG